MAGEPSLGSNNPFRRRAAAPAAPPSSPPAAADAAFGAPATLEMAPRPSPTHPPSGDDFQNLLRAIPKSGAPPPTTTFQKKKPVKKVRVQSPPSSPESAHAEHTYPEYPLPDADDDDDGSSSSSSSPDSADGEAGGEDPFRSTPPLARIEDLYGPDAEMEITPQPSGTAPPPNPFQKTLEDLEQPTRDEPHEAQGPEPKGKGGLDVDAFRRLLLTGQGPPLPPPVASPASSHLQPSAAAAGDGGSITDASSISRHSVFDPGHPAQDTPRTSHEVSEAEADDVRRALAGVPQLTRQPSRKKPPPPPPGSRHGKSIRKDGGLDGGALGSPITPGTSGPPGLPPVPTRRTSSSSDINKPLPPAPSRGPADEGHESIFDREAAGKVPDLDVDPEGEAIPSPRPPTPPNASHSSSTPVQNPVSTLRKPAPPPRRQPHARTESRTPSITGVLPPSHPPPGLPHADDAEAPLRSSMDSTHSRSSSIRAGLSSAPAPPPPRRPNHASRTTPARGVGSPPGAAPATSPSALSDPDRSPPAWPHHPPAAAPSPSQPRHSAAAPPPPPPARNSSVRSAGGRPASVSSLEAATRRPAGSGGGGGGGMPPPPPPRSRGGSKGSIDGSGGRGAPRRASAEGAVDSAANDILADLDALQREVDALRGRVGKK